MRTPVRLACVALIGSLASSAAFDFAQAGPNGTRGVTPPTLHIEDYFELPITGLPDGKNSIAAMLARVNAIREEPGGTGRLFIVDMNGPLYLFDKRTKALTTYLDFNGNEAKPGLFDKLTISIGLGNGLSALQLDPDYRRNGIFYTVHMEDPKLPGTLAPDSAGFPGLSVAAYKPTDPIATPGPTQTEGVLVEWTDTNPRNSTFEGTARELLRVQLNTRIHPLGDLIFNPAARRGDADWRVLYVACGDGGSGESKNLAMRWNPQRLDNLVGKILRIIPDLSLHPRTSRVSDNGRYRVPNDNPFASTTGARGEIWAYGLRNPQRLAWGTDGKGTSRDRLIANSVGLRTWETVYLIRKGENYGYPLREGTEVLEQDNTLAPLPPDDRVPVHIGETRSDRLVTPAYPVIQYRHEVKRSYAIGSGYVYQGRQFPALRGKYIFNDLATGQIWYANYRDMLAADDGRPETLARTTEVKVEWKAQTFDTMLPVVLTAYRARGGRSTLLPQPEEAGERGRADVRLATGASGELYVYSKTDGTIRRVVSATGF